MDADAPLDIDNVFVSVSSEGLEHVPEFQRASAVTAETLSAIAREQASQLNASPHTPTQLLSRRVRPISSWLWSEISADDGSQPSSTDIFFERRLCIGVSKVSPRPPAWLLEGGGRELGRLTPRKRTKPLLDIGSDAELRRVHLEHENTRPPTYSFISLGPNIATNSVQVYHNAICMELRNMGLIASSLRKRVYDVNRDDVTSFFAWLTAFGDFLRIYFAASEKYVISVAEFASDSALREQMATHERKSCKMGIITYLEGIENMKRVAEAQTEELVSIVRKLCRMTDIFAAKIVDYLNVEIEQLPSLLQAQFQEKQIESFFHNISVQMHQQTTASILHTILSHGAASDEPSQRKWLRHHAQQLHKNKIISGRFIKPQYWIRKYNRTHQEHVLGFVKAEGEYGEIFV